MERPLHVGTTGICAHCGAPTPVGVDATCVACGAPIRLLEPLAVDCGWCSASNRRDMTASCTRCGGPLPSIPGNDPGPPPVQAPRALPAGYEGRVMYWKNVLVLIGIMFSVVFCWTIVFPLIGIPMWIVGHRKAKEKLRALTTGEPTRGRVTSVTLDTTQHINHQHPFLIAYTFDTPTGAGSGACASWDRTTQARKPGDGLWVVYAPDDPRVSAIWPPIR